MTIAFYAVMHFYAVSPLPDRVPSSNQTVRLDLRPVFHLEIPFHPVLLANAGDQSLSPSALKRRLTFLWQCENAFAFVIVRAPRQQAQLNKDNVMERIQMPHSTSESHTVWCCERSVAVLVPNRTDEELIPAS